MKQIYTTALLLVCITCTNAQTTMTHNGITTSLSPDTTIVINGISIGLSKDSIWIIDDKPNTSVDFDYLRSTDRPRKHGLYPGQKTIIIPATSGEKILIVRFDKQQYRFKHTMRGSGKEEDFLDVITWRQNSCDCGSHWLSEHFR